MGVVGTDQGSLDQFKGRNDEKRKGFCVDQTLYTSILLSYDRCKAKFKDRKCDYMREFMQ